MPAPFTAQEIAVLLGRDANKVWKTLRNIPPTGESILDGRKLRSYTHERLPREIQEELAAIARRLGFASIDADAPPALDAPPTGATAQAMATGGQGSCAQIAPRLAPDD